ncbi:MAG TPA: hypothetical protein PK605_06225 [Ignavibacteria bacterium]|nr:hypothetical protein [Ignavibacteria bacterium]HRF65151.1 hypothetical protein [Ignavibacteria bacterium]HRJ03981.1 hypothetical protein [Ignavibacteria bacterium]
MMEQNKPGSSEMESNRQHLKNLTEIRSLMERSSSFISLSGLSGISAGIMGLIAAYILHQKLFRFMDYTKSPMISAQTREEFIFFGITVSAAVLIVTFLAAIFFTARKAKKSGLPVWDGSAKRLVVNLFIPLITGGVFCLILIYQYFDWLVLPSMLVFYGLALLNAGKFTLSEIKWLGVSEIALGLVSMLFLNHAIYFWGAGFGLLNIIYGMVMYFKYEKNN